MRRPPAAGGPDHPRNLVAVHAVVNASFGSQLPETKLGYLDGAADGVLRSVARYLRERAASRIHAAFDAHFVAAPNRHAKAV